MRTMCEIIGHEWDGYQCSVCYQLNLEALARDGHIAERRNGSILIDPPEPNTLYTIRTENGTILAMVCPETEEEYEMISKVAHKPYGRKLALRYSWARNGWI